MIDNKFIRIVIDLMHKEVNKLNDDDGKQSLDMLIFHAKQLREALEQDE